MGIVARLGGFVLALGVTVAQAQTSTLQPFAFEGRVAVGTLAGRRSLSSVDLRLSGRDGIGAVPAFVADDPSTPELHDGRLTALLQRDFEGQLMEYQPTGQYSERPQIWLQNHTRWISPALSSITAPAEGGLAHEWLLDGLCSVEVSVWSGDPEVRIEQLLLEASNDEFVSGFTAQSEGSPPIQQSNGYLRTVIDGRQVIVAELLLPPGQTLTLEVEASYASGHSTTKTLTVSANAARCAGDPSPQPLPLLAMPPPAMGQVASSLRLVPDPSMPVEPPAVVELIQATLTPPAGRRTVSLGGTPDPVDSTVRQVAPVVEGHHTFSLEAVLSWPDELFGRLTLARDVSAARFTPVVPLPLPAGPQKGFYPDLSIVVSDAEVEMLGLDDVFVVGEGRLSPFGCMTAADLEGGEVSWQTTADMPASVMTELGTPTSEDPFPSVTFGPIVPRTDRFRLPVLEGEWRESYLALRFRRPGSGGGATGVHADVQWFVEPLLAQVATFARGALPVVPPRDLPVGAVTVTLRVLDPITGLPRLFRSPEVTVTQEGGELGSLTVRAFGDDALREVHHVVVPSLPGTYDVAIMAQVPETPSDPESVVLTALPTLMAVPFRAPRPDGSCTAICNDPGVNVYWDDDLAPPSIELDDVPLRVYEPFVDLTGVAFDESPITSVHVQDVAVPLDGDDTTPRRAFSVRVPVDEDTQSVTVVARDRCGGEVVVTRPVSLWRNTPPSIAPIRVLAREGEPVEAPMEVIDPDAVDPQAPQPLTFTLAGADALPGTSRPAIDASGVLTWTPGFEQSGLWSFRVTVSDGVATDEALVVVDVEEVNRPPAIERVGSVPVTGLLAFPVGEGERLELLVEASDPDGDELTFAAFGLDGELPAGLTLSPDGRLVWSPSFEQEGDHLVEVVVFDGRGGEDRQTLLLRVGDVNRAPVVEGPSVVVVAEGESLALDYLAHDPDGQPVAWFIEPESLRLRGLGFETSDSTARLEWTPGFEDAGDYLITISVTDTEGAKGQLPILLQVTNTNRAPTFAPVPPQVADGWPGGFDVVASDPDGQPITCTATRLPEGVAWDAEQRRVSWEDLLWPQGPLPVVVTCSDGEAEGVLEVDVNSEHFDLVGGCACAGGGAGPLAFLALAFALRRRRSR